VCVCVCVCACVRVCVRACVRACVCLFTSMNILLSHIGNSQTMWQCTKKLRWPQFSNPGYTVTESVRVTALECWWFCSCSWFEVLGLCCHRCWNRPCVPGSYPDGGVRHITWTRRLSSVLVHLFGFRKCDVKVITYFRHIILSYMKLTWFYSRFLCFILQNCSYV
jgi:hypothetical protein